MNSISTRTKKHVSWLADRARATAALSLLTTSLLVIAVAQARLPQNRQMTTGEDDIQIRLQQQMLTETDAKTLENKIAIQSLQQRLADLETRQSFVQGSIVGFGSLLSILQVLGLIRKRNENNGKIV